MRVDQTTSLSSASQPASPRQLQQTWQAQATIVDRLVSTVDDAKKQLDADSAGWRPKSTDLKRALQEQKASLDRVFATLSQATRKLFEFEADIVAAMGMPRQVSALPEVRQEIRAAATRNALPEAMENQASALRKAARDALAVLSEVPGRADGRD